MKPMYRLVWGWACALPLAASAQWQWIDDSGRKVFSDQPPPIDIPEKNILRHGNVPAPRTSAPQDTPPAGEHAAAKAEAGAPKSPGVDKELEERTRKAEEAEKAKQAAEAAKVAKTRAENCARARQGKATMDSGIRVARLNAQGEREILDDAARAEEQRHLDEVIASECN